MIVTIIVCILCVAVLVGCVVLAGQSLSPTIHMTNIIFILSCSLFVSYTVVSLAFLKKKRMALRDMLHDAVTKHMVKNGEIEPSAETALSLLKEMDSQFQEFNDEAQVVYSNIIKSALLTASIGVCYALSMVIY